MNDNDKVILYSKPNFLGNAYAINIGDYTSTYFIPQISPDNVFSLSIPPNMSVKLFCGDIYDYGNKGFVHITNVSKDNMSVPSLPQYIAGYIRSISISDNIDTTTSININSRINTNPFMKNILSNNHIDTTLNVINEGFNNHNHSYDFNNIGVIDNIFIIIFIFVIFIYICLKIIGICNS